LFYLTLKSVRQIHRAKSPVHDGDSNLPVFNLTITDNQHIRNLFNLCFPDFITDLFTALVKRNPETFFLSSS
jgi:hypothetical protein